jgi:hypothetical protein
MNKSLFALVFSVGLLGLTFVACAKTYTESELQTMERKEDMTVGAQERRDAELATEGGSDAAEDEDNAEEIDREVNQ